MTTETASSAMATSAPAEQAGKLSQFGQGLARLKRRGAGWWDHVTGGAPSELRAQDVTSYFRVADT